MSGIAGIIHFDGAPVVPGLVEKMTAAMAYRGPDGINHWIKGSVALGQCMLRTTPESLEENQPLANEDQSLVLVMDGRVDNWEELRKELLGRGAVLRSRTDAELVLRAYQIWGKDCLARIDGDFALVIWDAKRKMAFCARDRMGNRPLNYHWDGKTFVFASELHAIIGLPWVTQELNDGMLAELLAAEWHSRDETLWLGIKRLVASHSMETGGKEPKPERYWMPDLQAPLSYPKHEEYVEHYRELLSDAVKRMSRSHQTLACEVSGGLDSSALYAMARYLLGQGKLLAPSLDGYTLDFHDNPAANELEYAEAAGRHWGEEIRKVPPADMPVSWYRDWARHYLECPPYPNGAMGLSVRAAARSRGSRVLLAGIGGDEWLWGDRDYYAELLSTSQFKLLLQSLMADASEAGLLRSIWWLFRMGMIPLLPETMLEALRGLVKSGPYSSSDTKRWLAKPMLGVLQERRARYGSGRGAREKSPGFRSRIAMLNSAISALARESEERLAASAGIEVRLPFWDPRMVQFAFSIPSQLRLRGNTDRALHREAMAGLLPPAVLTRKTKANFMVTYQKGLADLEEDLTGRVASRRMAWVNVGEVAQLYRRCNREDLGWCPEWQLWTLFGCDCLAEVALKP